MERQIYCKILRHSQLRQNGLVLRVEHRNDLLIHICPTCHRLLCAFETVFGEDTTGEDDIFIQRNGVHLLFRRMIRGCRIRPNTDNPVAQKLISFLEFGQTPLILLSDPLIDSQTRILKPMSHISFVSKRAVRISRIVSSQRQVARRWSQFV